ETSRLLVSVPFHVRHPIAHAPPVSTRRLASVRQYHHKCGPTEDRKTAIRSWAVGHLPAGAFVARIVRVVVRRVVVSRIACRARGDPLLQLFNFELNLILVFHCVSPPFCIGIKSVPEVPVAANVAGAPLEGPTV